MNTANDALWSYLLKLSENDPSQLLKTIDDFDLKCIFHDKLRTLSQEYFLQAVKMMIAQKQWNQLILNELSQLSDECDRVGIKMVNHKGLTLAWEAYVPPETRQFGDIDVLIGKKDQDSCRAVVEKLGYFIGAKEESLCWIKRSGAFDSPHHWECEKVFSDFDFFVSLEVHLRPSFLMPEEIDMAPFIARAIHKKVNGHPFWVLNPADKILCLVAHWTQHYIVSGLSEKRIPGSISGLHDIALVIDNHSLIIDWETLLLGAKRFDLYPELAFVMKAVNHIYPGRVPKGWLEKLLNEVSDKHQLFSSYIFSRLVNMPPDETLYAIPPKVLNTFEPHKNYPLNTNVILCPYSVSESSPKEEFDIPLQETGNLDSSPHLFKGNIWWEQDYWCINMRIEKAVFPFRDNSIELTFYDDKLRPYCRQFWAVLSKLENQETLDLVTHGDENFWLLRSLPSDTYSYSISSCPENYNIILKLPWRILNIEPEKGKQMGFNAAVILSDNSNNDTYFWSPYRKARWHEFYKYAVMILT